MPDWTKPMQQTFEYYEVNPETWEDGKRLRNVKSNNITRDTGAETLGSASIDVTESLGECYIRTYLVTIQDGITEKHPLGIHLVQTPSSSYNGRIRNVSMDAYTPLLELKENKPPIGYHIPKGKNIMETAYQIVQEHVRAPVVPTICTKTLSFDFVADTNDTWLSFVISLIENADYILDLDEMGRVLFAPKQDTDSLQSVWTYTDDDISILTPDLTMDHDLFGIPNVVEVIYSNGGVYYYAKAVNDDPNSPTSTVNRGRQITERITNPSIIGNATQSIVDAYAKQALRELSTAEYTITYTHGYCPVRPNDCVRINYSGAGLVNIKAKVINQNIKCTPGCLVTEKAVYTVKLWR
jgi:hypothetical protein